tara:strand:+ start:1389 stop:1964 length:576 start_codon:yes stop_codon:yes gene_type:complete
MNEWDQYYEYSTSDDENIKFNLNIPIIIFDYTIEDQYNYYIADKKYSKLYDFLTYENKLSLITTKQLCNNVVSIRLPLFRTNVIDDCTNFVQYLILIKINNYEFGTWKRYKEIEDIKSNLNRNFTESKYSWDILKYRKKLFRCLESQYILLKCYLIEVFLRNILIESHDIVFFLSLFFDNYDCLKIKSKKY